MLSIDLSGTRFEITLPPQDYDFPERPRSPKVNVFDSSIYNYNSKPNRNGNPAGNEGISVPGILKREWFTYGPVWRFRNLGILGCSTVICDTSEMAGDLNCFNPDQLERLIMHSMYNTFGPGFRANEYTCPVNWKIRNIQGVDWVYLESWSKKPEWKDDASQYHDANFSVVLFTPIFNDKFLLLSFNSTGSLPAEASNRAMFERIEAIISGLKLQLSTEALKQKAEAEQRFPEARYSSHRESEPWKYYTSYRPGDTLKGEKSLVIEGPCSPPPDLF